MLNKTIRFGLITGVIITIYMALLYAGGLEIFANWWFSILLYPILIFCMFFYAVRIRNAHPDEPFQFKNAFITLFMIGMTATGVLLIWHILLFNVIDTDLSALMAENILAQTMEMMEKWGAPQAAIDQTIVEMEKLPDQFKPAGQLISWLKGSILFIIISAIGGLIIRRKESAMAVN